MAIEVKTDEQRLAEFTSGLDSLRPEGFDEASYAKLKEALVSFHEEDVKGLKINTAKAIQEKDDMAVKLKNLQASTGEKDTKIEELNKQLEASQPEEQKKFFENQIGQMKLGYETQLKNLSSENETLKAKVSELEKGVLERDVLSDFNKAASKREWLGGGREAAQKVVLSGIEFTRLQMPDGTMTLIDKKTSKDIETILNDFCSTEVGKSFLRSGTSGGGADGSTSSGTGTQGKMTQAQFEKLSPEAKMTAVLEGKF